MQRNQTSGVDSAETQDGLAFPIALWVILVVSFLALVSLYAKFGEPLVVKVYELQQLARGEAHVTQHAISAYEDYLRVDPKSIRARGLLVNTLIEGRQFTEALEHASEGLAHAEQHERPIAQLVLVRVHLANGDIEAAAGELEKALDALPESGEAHYQLAQIHLARGQFSEMEDEYARVGALGPKDSSQEYANEWDRRQENLADYEREVMDGIESPERLSELGIAFEKLGRIEEAMKLFEQAEARENPSTLVLFWAGVRLERSGNLPEATRLYDRAMHGSRPHPYARYARDRLTLQSE